MCHEENKENKFLFSSLLITKVEGENLKEEKEEEEEEKFEKRKKKGEN